jgi:uncharacterized repeat protein (TIGR03843 family)
MCVARDEKILNALKEGELDVKGEFLWGSNYTFLAEVGCSGDRYKAVYKPIKGERPLWDFPPTSLAHREVAAYLVSEALTWRLVPPTVYRENAPYGAGSLQLFIEHDPEYHYFNFSQEDHQRLRPVVLFDTLVNNADRKGSHIMVDEDNHIWLIDHGICFHVDYKLRTVVWDFAGEDIPDVLMDDLSNFRQKFKPRNGESSEFINLLSAELNPTEIAALATRADKLLVGCKFLNPRSDHRPYPWPPV